MVPELEVIPLDLGIEGVGVISALGQLLHDRRCRLTILAVVQVTVSSYWLVEVVDSPEAWQ